MMPAGYSPRPAAGPEENALFRACPEDYWLAMLNPEGVNKFIIFHSLPMKSPIQTTY